MGLLLKLPKKPNGFKSIQVVAHRLTKFTHFLLIKEMNEMEKLTNTCQRNRQITRDASLYHLLLRL